MLGVKFTMMGQAESGRLITDPFGVNLGCGPIDPK